MMDPIKTATTVIIIIAFCAVAMGQTTRESEEAADLNTVGRRLEYLERLGRTVVDPKGQPTKILEMVKELEVGEIDAPRCFAAAEAAFLIGSPQAAIIPLERLIKSSPEEKAPGLNIPVSVAANFRIGTAARYSGQAERAMTAYRAALLAVDNMRGRDKQKPGLKAIAMLYIAEIQIADNRSPQAIATLQEMTQLPALPPGQGVPVDMYKGWAEAMLAALQAGKPDAAPATRTVAPFSWMMLSLHLDIAGLTDVSELGRHGNSGEVVGDRLLRIVSASTISKVDKSVAMLMSANLLEMKGEYKAAYGSYSTVLDEPDYWAADGGAGAIRCLLALDKAEEANKAYEQAVAKSPKLAVTLKSLLSVRKPKVK